MSSIRDRKHGVKFQPRLEALEDRRLMAIVARITDLGTLGGDLSVPYSINEKGQIAGFSNLTKGGINHAFMWDPAKGMIDLGALPGGTHSGAYGINDLGQVVGVSTSSKGTRAFVWDEVNGIQDLGTPWEGPGGRCNAWDINDLGQIVGSCIFPNDPKEEHTKAVIWQGGSELSLIPNQWGTDFSYAYGINNNGDIVGWAVASNGEPHAYLYDGGLEGTMKDLGTLGGPNSKAYRVDLQQNIVGAASSGGRYDKAFYYSDGVMKNIPTLGGAFNYAYGINDAGWVVGRSYTSPPNIHAYLYKDGDLFDLNNYIEPTSVSGWRALTEAKDINNSNQIVGWGRRWKEKHGYIMTIKFTDDLAPLSTLPPRATLTQIPATANTTDVSTVSQPSAPVPQPIIVAPAVKSVTNSVLPSRTIARVTPIVVAPALSLQFDVF